MSVPGFQCQGGSPRLHASSPVCNGTLRFISGATPADILVPSMAALCRIFTAHNGCGKVMFYGCLSVHRGCLLVDVVLSHHAIGPTPWADTPWADTSPWADTPCGQTSPMGKHPLWADTPLGIHPPGQTPLWADDFLGRHPPPRQTPPSRPLKRAVCILMDCILVTKKLCT